VRPPLFGLPIRRIVSTGQGSIDPDIWCTGPRANRLGKEAWADRSHLLDNSREDHWDALLACTYGDDKAKLSLARSMFGYLQEKQVPTVFTSSPAPRCAHAGHRCYLEPPHSDR
jgi:hypothetical protein